MFHPTFTSIPTIHHNPYNPLCSVRAKHEGSNLQDIDGRSRIGSGEATMTNADSNPSHQIPILQFKNRQPFGQITTNSAQVYFLLQRMRHVSVSNFVEGFAL
jgi:hypothetical protein